MSQCMIWPHSVYAYRSDIACKCKPKEFLKLVIMYQRGNMKCTYNVVYSTLARTTNAWQNTLPIVSEHRPQLFEMKNGLFGLFANKCVPCGSLRFVLEVSTKKIHRENRNFRFRSLGLRARRCLKCAQLFTQYI